MYCWRYILAVFLLPIYGDDEQRESPNERPDEDVTTMWTVPVLPVLRSTALRVMTWQALLRKSKRLAEVPTKWLCDLPGYCVVNADARR
jgi:hypothetical protein